MSSRGTGSSVAIADEREVAERLRSAGPVVEFRGGGTKSPPSSAGRGPEVAPGEPQTWELAALSGVVEYEPTELTLTAKAATPMSEIAATLGAHGQYLPFDPLLVEESSTIGGTVAANASGPGRLAAGGVRDFVLGVRFVDGEGRAVASGGRVVKNAAGLDLSKLLVGSHGGLGCLTEITVKVFPTPATRATLLVHQLDLDRLCGLFQSLSRSPFSLAALDAQNVAVGRARRRWTLAVQLAGPPESMPERLSVLETWARVRASSDHDVEILRDAEERAFWRRAGSLAWLDPAAVLVKIPLTPRRFSDLERSGLVEECDRVFSANQQLLVSLPFSAVGAFSGALAQLGLRGQVLRWGADLSGGCPRLLGAGMLGEEFLRRVRSALDPGHRFHWQL